MHGSVSCWCRSGSRLASQCPLCPLSDVVQAYGKTTYLITNLKLVPRGTEGAVSLEGTLAGLAAAAAYAGIALVIGQVRGWASTELSFLSAAVGQCA